MLEHERPEELELPRESTSSPGAPASPSPRAARGLRPEPTKRPFGVVLLPTLITVVFVVLGVYVFEQYGSALFIVVPIALGFSSGYVGARWPRGDPHSSAIATLLTNMAAVVLVLLVVALEGIVCVAMAAPLAFLFALPGMFVALTMFRIPYKRSARWMAGVALPLVPLAMFVEKRTDAQPAMRAVVTSVLVDAPIERVWETVVAFPRIESEPAWYFRLGIAHPLEARIDGQGVGAIRYCTFSTGSFVEPITIWDAPHLLAFDVTESPPPLEELSLYDHVHAPHLDGYLVSRRGQFRLEQRGDQVLLEGTTWYTHDMAPAWYWGAISDALIHRIHERVLEHIAEVAEAR
jgi:hypothetical protein